MNRDYFELQRLSDDLVYRFDRKIMPDGQTGHQRRDQDLWIIWQAALGWIAYDEATNSVMGRPWDVLAEHQTSQHPPEGIWVSRKAEKSYVYRLRFVTPNGQASV